MQGEDGLDKAGDPGGRAPELAEKPPGLEGGHGLLDKCADLRVGPVDGLLACGEVLPTSPVRNPDRAPGASVSLVGPAGDASVCESGDDAVFTGGPGIVDGSGQSWRRPQQPAGRISQDLHVHPVLLVLAGVEGAVRGDPVDRQEGAVQQNERLGRCRPGRLRESRGEGGQELNGLGDVPVGRRGSDAESGCELGIRVAVARVGEGEWGLLVRAQAPPSGTEFPAAPTESGGQEAQGRTGHVDARRVDKHTKPLVETDFLVENPSTRGFTCLSAQLTCPVARLERAQWLHRHGDQFRSVVMPVDHDLGDRALRASGPIPEWQHQNSRTPFATTSGRGRPDTLK